MIESNVMSSSSCDSDLFQDISNDFFSLSENECVDQFHKDFSTSSCLTPDNLSCISSDYECLNLEDAGLLPFTDSFISQILEDNSIDFGDSDWSLLLDNENCDSSIEHPVSITNSRKTKKPHRYQSSKLWSKMSPEEQINTLHILSEIVTCHMGITEQIEVIKIIDPSVTISPDDTEFALDSSFLNDSKMKRIREFVQKHGFSLTFPKKSNLEASSAARKALSTKASSRTKRRQKKQKISMNENISQRKKLELHGQKEAQSGLFVYEKVIKLINPLEEDEDVNILE